MLSGEARNADFSAELSQEAKAESLAESSQKARPKGRFIRHLSRARQISLSFQPQLHLVPASKLSPSIPKTHHPQAAAIIIANNIDILQQILLYLPPRSLLRFQCVSKKWLSIISDPSFRRLHTRFYPTTIATSFSAAAATTEALFVFPWTYNDTPQELNFISLSDGYVNPMAKMVSNLNNFFDNGEIVHFHSCNGLLALVFKLDDYDDHREFVVYNPTTRRHRLIPKLNNAQLNHPQLNDPQFDDPEFDDPPFHGFPGIEITRRFEAFNIVFDPSKSDHFKLVYVWRDDHHGVTSESCGFSVYASETGIWRESVDTLEMEHPDLFTTYFGNGVLWNGDLHWVSDWKHTICFDMDKECLHPGMPSLPVELGEENFWYFGESNGCLCVIEVNNPFWVLFDVFEMARDYSKWVLKHHIDLAPVRTLYPSIVVVFVDHAYRRQCRFGPFGLPFYLEDEMQKKASLVIALKDKVILYNTKDAIVTDLAEVGLVDFSYNWKSHFYQWKDTYRHTETLAYV